MTGRGSDVVTIDAGPGRCQMEIVAARPAEHRGKGGAPGARRPFHLGTVRGHRQRSVLGRGRTPGGRRAESVAGTCGFPFPEMIAPETGDADSGSRLAPVGDDPTPALSPHDFVASSLPVEIGAVVRRGWHGLSRRAGTVLEKSEVGFPTKSCWCVGRLGGTLISSRGFWTPWMVVTSQLVPGVDV